MGKKLKVREIPFLLLVLIVFITVAGKYHQYWLGDLYNKFIQVVYPKQERVRVAQVLNECPIDQVLIRTSNGNLCRVHALPSKTLEIFDNYPALSDQRATIYEFLNEGNIELADMMLEDQMPIDRFEPVELQYPITWEEDPYNEKYWRFMYYSLRETRHLLFAYKQTGQDKYRDKLIYITESFLDEGMDKKYSWDDYHAVAFRSMILVNTWWKLREENALSVTLNEKILKSLQIHGDFLLDNRHYEPQYNHGISEASALLLIGINFPDLENSDKWIEVAKERINSSMNNLVDVDGALVENSPYYHFYALEKYWRIAQYYKNNNLEISPDFHDKLDKMIHYATFILQPNLDVPLLGASLDRSIGNAGVFKDIAKSYPEFMYVLTQGKDGDKPSDLNKYYSTTGQTIMRSGWEYKTKLKNYFENQTQVIFDVGPYRTNHSDLDALSINLYSNGKTLITDTGLYTYEADSDLKSYFHGTAGHNTIMLDGIDQRLGSPVPGNFTEGNGFVSQSAQHNLYPQTIHQRNVALIGHDFVLVIDKLISTNEHDYEQLFHLFPDAKTELKNGKLEIFGKDGKELTIHQLVGNQSIATKNGLCSFEYEKTTPCPVVVTKKHDKNATFVTLLEVGSNSGLLSAKFDNNEIVLNTKSGIYSVDINEMESNFFVNSKSKKEEVKKYNLNLKYINDNWKLEGQNSEDFNIKTDKNKIVITPKNRSNDENFSKRSSYAVNIDGMGEYYSIDQNIYLDIPSNPKTKNIQVYEQEDMLPILGYHHILDNDIKITSPTLEIHVSDFEKQIDYLTNVEGCRWFTFSDIMNNFVLKNEKVPKRACILNFDDGRKDHFTNGFRVFDKYGAVATFYIIAQRAIGNNEAYMNLNDLDTLYRNGNEIGSHTVDAGTLLSAEYKQNDLTYQLAESKKMLEDQGYAVDTFAYPRGEWSNNIVTLVKGYYLAGRDTNKDNLWRDMRTTTVGFTQDHIWHMHYFKPELLDPKELQKVVGYNSWWQFEEGYKVNKDNGQKIRELSSYDPTDNSYGVVDLNDVGDSISNKFIVSADGSYMIQSFLTVNTSGSQNYSEDTVDIFVDGLLQKNIKDINAEKCSIYRNQYYCGYSVYSKLSKGIHVLTIESKIKGIKLDKFKMYRSLPTQDQYAVIVSKLQKIESRQYPEQIITTIDKMGYIKYWIYSLYNLLISLN